MDTVTINLNDRTLSLSVFAVLLGVSMIWNRDKVSRIAKCICRQLSYNIKPLINYNLFLGMLGFGRLALGSLPTLEETRYAWVSKEVSPDILLTAFDSLFIVVWAIAFVAGNIYILAESKRTC